jgi:hypothetical protein
VTDLEARLERALKAGDPAPRDPMFRIELMVRRERAALRRQLLTALAMACVAAILAALGLAVLYQAVGPGPGRLATIVAAGVMLTAFLAAPFVGPFPSLRSLAAHWRASALSTLRTMPGLRR